MYSPAVLAQRAADRCLERRVVVAGRHSRAGEMTVLGEVQVLFQCYHTTCLGGSEIDLIRANRAEQHTALACARHEHIQPSPTALAIERPEIHRYLAVLVRAVPDTEENDIAFVALDGFEVLDEEWL